MELDIHDIWPSLSETYGDITDFDETMFLSNPIRSMKLGELLSVIPEYSWLRIKLLRASKGSCFWQIADAFERTQSKDYKQLWEFQLPESKNNFLDELKNNQKISFSSNEIEDITAALDFVFPWNRISGTSASIKDRALSFLPRI